MLNLFSVPIYSTQLNLNTNKITKYCLSVRKKTKGIRHSNEGGWHSPFLVGAHPPLNDLFKEILKAGEIYRNTISYKYPLALQSVWININSHKDYNLEHIHPHNVVSGTYYLTSENSDIVFINPSRDVMQYDWGNDVIEKYNEHNSCVWNIKPAQNQLILFPSWLNHSVERNLNKKDRMCIAFNLIRQPGDNNEKK